jgi:hypothetical protein
MALSGVGRLQGGVEKTAARGEQEGKSFFTQEQEERN